MVKQKKKILILGAAGNLGAQLTKAFQADDAYEVISWDRAEIDVTDKELINKKITELKPRFIVNAAAYNAVDKCENNEEEFALAQKLNKLAPGYLAEAALGTGAVLVHYSTDYVFGGSDMKADELARIKARGGFGEDDKTCPANKYGLTKRGGEEEIIKYSGLGLRWYLIRTSKLFGPRGASLAAKPSFFDIMLKLAQEKDVLEVVDEEISCFTYTPDLAQATKNLIESSAGFGIYHLVNSGPATWYEAAQELFKIISKPVKLKPVTASHFPRPAKRPAYSVLLNTKFTHLRPWVEALREYLLSNKS